MFARSTSSSAAASSRIAFYSPSNSSWKEAIARAVPSGPSIIPWQRNPRAARALNTTVAVDVKGETLDAKHDKQQQQAARKPRPPPSPALPKGIAAWFMGHAAAMLEKDPSLDPRTTPGHRLHERRYGWYTETNSKTIMVNLMGTKLIYCADPAVYKEVLGEKQGSFTNSNSFRAVFGHLFPNSMIVLEGEDWQRIRRISQKALNRMDLNKVIGSSIEVIDSAVAHNTLGIGNDVECYKALSLITFDIFHKVMYSMDPKAVTSDPNNPHVKLIEACDNLLYGIRYRSLSRQSKWMWDLPLKSNKVVNQARDYILEVGKQIIAKRRQELQNELKKSGENAKTGTLLDGLLISQDEELMRDVEVLDQIATFFFGAFETTSNTLLLTLDGLAYNQAAQKKLRAELRKAFPNGKEDLAKAKLADLDAVTYLLWTVDEAFRLNSTAWGFPRDCIKDVVVGGYEIKAGDMLLIDHRSVSRDPSFWHDQENLGKFDPDRFASYPLEKLHSLPFGFGGRICPGRRIAIAEIKSLIAYLVLQYEILPPEDVSKSLVIDTKLGLTCADGTGFMRFKPLAA